MKAKSAIASIAVMCAGVVAGGCDTMKQMGVFVPQGPGNAPDGKVVRTPPQAAPAPQPAPPVNSRKLDVAPDLIGTAPIPPVKPSADSPLPFNTYTQSTRYGDLLYISGQIPLDLRTNTLYDSATIEEQTRVVMENIRLILEGNRLTMANIVSTTVYMKNVNDIRGMNQVYESYFKGSPPARTVVEVAKLPRGVALQISAVAGR